MEKVGSWASLAMGLSTMASSSLVKPWAAWRESRSDGGSATGSPGPTSTNPSAAHLA